MISSGVGPEIGGGALDPDAHPSPAGPAGAIRVIVADDHPAQRAGIRAVLEPAGFAIVAEAATAEGAVEAVGEHLPDLVLLDVRMPGDGLRAAEVLAAQHPGTAVVMLTVSQDEADAMRALRAGAHGYLHKAMDPERLPVALRAVMEGESAFPRVLVRRALDELGGRHRRRITLPGGRGTRLTDREWEVLELLGAGGTTASIASALGVSTATVRTHVSTLVHKLRVPDRDAAVALLDHR